MLRASRNPAVIAFLLLAFLIIDRGAGRAQQKAAVFGTPTANMRAGAGVEHALKTTLKEGDPVVVDNLEGEWYLVTAADGQKGYVHKNFLKLAADTTAQPAPAQPPAPQPNTAEVKAPPKGAAVVPAPAPIAPPPPAPPAKPAEAKSQSIMQMLEGHEAEVKIGLFIAGVAFAIGWFCGGSFYQRRERKSRYKLRF
jgi:uncharacterized protein YgiM (DUF1202 family)